MSLDRVTFRLDGTEIAAPREWEGMAIKATFDNDGNEANISTDQFTFVSDAADTLHAHRIGGLTGGPGIFEGPCFDIFINNQSSTFKAFEGFVSMTGDYTERGFKGANFTNPTEVVARLGKLNDINSLQKRIEGIDVQYLKSEGVYTDADYIDVPWIIEAKFDPVQFITTGVVVYAITKETIEAATRLSNNTKEIITTITDVPTGPARAIILLGLQILIETAYIIVMFAQVLNLMDTLLNNIISPKRIHKGITLRTLVGNALNHFGFELVSPIPELDSYVYLPSKPDGLGTLTNRLLNLVDVINEGIPNRSDYGYLITDAIELCLRTFNARLSIVGNKVHIRTKADTWWIKQSSYVMPPVLLDSIKFNTDELKANILLAFTTDVSDEFTITDSKGAIFENITQTGTVINERKVEIAGLDVEGDLPMSLGSRKDELSAIEKALIPLAGLADVLIGTNLRARIKERLGVLKTSGQQHSIAKLLYMPNGKNIDVNHRDNLSATYLWDAYHSEKSFIDNGFNRQRVLFEGVEIPLRLNDFNSLLNNSYFTTETGAVGKFTSLDWVIGADRAKADFWITLPYTKNLKQIDVEP